MVFREKLEDGSIKLTGANPFATPPLFVGRSWLGTYTANSNMWFGQEYSYGVEPHLVPGGGGGIDYVKILTAGKYRIRGQFKHDASTVQPVMQIFNNGNRIFMADNPSATAYAGSAAETVADLAVNDQISFRASANFTHQSDAPAQNSLFLIHGLQSSVIVPPPTNPSDSGWITPVLQNSWSQYNGWEPVSYRKINGIVYLRGLLAVGSRTNGAVIFNLPVGFRPSSNSHTPVLGSDGVANQRVNIMADGNVQVNTISTGSGWVSLSNLSFPVN